MAAVEFGVAMPSVKGIPEFAQKAEALGFDYLGSGEHMMFHGAVPNSLINLSVAAGATKKIKLMSTVVLLPLYTPMVLAKMTAVLDVASDGRYHMGIGVGGEFPKEFEACGVPVKQRGSRSNEALEVITKLWTGKNVAFDGRYTKFSGVTLDPSPVQKPHPPIWVAGRKESAMRRAALYAQGWLPYMYTPEMLHESVEKIMQFGKEAGRDMSSFRPGLFIFAVVHPDRDKAREQAAKALGGTYAQDFSKIAGRYTLYGNPDDCRKRLREYVDAGARTVMVSLVCRQEEYDANLRMLAQEIAPAFR
ncbi:MAG TPA: LLM class flavin-dependent oxidoreductase [Candidatus Binataceae bacterium]|jgi:probable F420-dependent oxidoreductase|nr:LLM class flavin-dependent oxidoreductase [Candidatus Binataceae bacterium]